MGAFDIGLVHIQFILKLYIHVITNLGGKKMSINSRKKTKRISIFVVVVIILAAVLALPGLRRTSNTNYTEVIPAKGDITTYYSFSGSVEAKNRQSVLADRIMQIESIKVEIGQVVKKDDVLIETTTGEKIKAKIDGEVSNIYVEENAQVMSGGKLMDIVDYSDLQLKVQVDEYDLSAVEKDKEAAVTIHALSKDVSGKIAEVSKEGNYLNGVTYFTAIISLEKNDAIRVGMSAEAKVLNQSVKDALTLNMSSINFDNSNKPYVLIKNDKGVPQRREITIGINDGVIAEVKSGIAINDIVLVAAKSDEASFRPGGIARGMNDNNNSTAAGGNRQ